MKKTVALIYGGEGREREISALSAKNLYRLIDKERFSVISVFISECGDWFILSKNGRTPTFPIRLSGKSGLYSKGEILRIDAAIPCLHGDMGEDGIIAGALRTAGISFVGAGTVSAAACSDKIITKSVAEALGIPTAKWIYATEKESADTVRKRAEAKLSYPLFIKPSLMGSSIGITRAFSSEDFADAYREALSYSQRLLIEEAVSVNTEIECAYLELLGCKHYSIGAVLSDGKFYGFSEKYSDGGTPTAEKSTLDEKTEKTVISYAKSLRNAISVEGLGRFDFFLTDSKKILFNEINVFPGMTPTSLYPRLTVNMGLSEGEFINLLISEAIYDRRF